MVIEEQEPKKRTRVSRKFVNILAIISIMGFVNIISYSLFYKNIDTYTEALLFGIMGLGFIIESSPIQLSKRIRSDLSERSFTAMTTLIVGLLSLTAGILTLPQINLQNPGFLAVKGITSIIAIMFIMIQTWIIK